MARGVGGGQVRCTVAGIGSIRACVVNAQPAEHVTDLVEISADDVPLPALELRSLIMANGPKQVRQETEMIRQFVQEIALCGS